MFLFNVVHYDDVFSIRLVPLPTSVSIIKPIEPVFAEYHFNLSCTANFSHFVDIPIRVCFVWSGPDGRLPTLIGSVIAHSTMQYISTVTFISSTTLQSETFKCGTQARLNSSYYVLSNQSFTNTVTITVGKVLHNIPNLPSQNVTILLI